MKRKKAQGGFTLVELSVAIALLAILSAGIIGLVYTSYQNYQANQKKQEDEYNARNALVFITREIHSGTSEARTEDAGGNSKLTLTTFDDAGDVVKEIEFSLDANNVLQRKVIKAPAGYDMPFVADKLELTSFIAELSEDGKRVLVSITCRNGLELDTRVALSRTQQPATTAEP